MTEDSSSKHEQMGSQSDKTPMRSTVWQRGISIFLVAFGWSVGFLALALRIQDHYASPSVASTLGGLIAGAATALAVCVEARPPWGYRYRLLLMIACLFIEQWLLGDAIWLGMGSDVGYALLYWGYLLVAICLGFLVIGLFLRWIVRGFQGRHVRALVVTGVGLVSLGLFAITSYESGIRQAYLDMSSLVVWAVTGLIIGALWGWVMIDQITRARRRAEKAPPTPLPLDPTQIRSGRATLVNSARRGGLPRDVHEPLRMGFYSCAERLVQYPLGEAARLLSAKGRLSDS